MTTTPPPAKGSTLSHAIFLTVLTSFSLALLPSCRENDPSYEKEALKLSAEKAALEVRLETANKELETLQSKVKNIQTQHDAMADKAATVEAKPAKIDVDKIKLGFAKAVSDLGAQIEGKHPEYTVESVTFQKMKLPTDYPFSSGVVTTLRSKKTGAKQLLYWEAQGNLEGKWRFANKKKPTTSVAENTPTPSAPGTTTQPRPNRPTTQPPVTRPPVTRPPVSDGNSHVIDWGRIK